MDGCQYPAQNSDLIDHTKLACATPVSQAIQSDWIANKVAMAVEELTATFSAALAGRLRRAIANATGIPLPTPSPLVTKTP